MTEQTQTTDAAWWIITAQAELDGVETDDSNNCLKAARGALEKALNEIAKWGTPAGAGEVVAVVGTDAGGVHLYYEGKYLGPQPAKKTVMLLKDLPLGTQLFTTPQPTQAQAGAVPLTDEQLWANDEIMSLNADLGWHMDTIRMFVRVIEHAHGIKGADHG